MASKRENRKMVDMLERMGMIKKEGEEVPLREAPVSAPSSENQPAPAPAPAAEPKPAESLPAFTVPVTETSALPAASSAAYAERRSLSASSPLSSLSEGFWDDTPDEMDPVERFMEISDLYRLFDMQTGGVDTVYLLEEYIKTLPDSLPAELRRSIIVRIVQASGFDFDKLLSDGIDRVSRLNDYATDFAVRTDAVVTQQNETIAELERQIELVRAVINERKNLHKKQFLTIENETQRLKKVLDFITK